jgi:predicted ribonuclease YlaK
MADTNVYFHNDASFNEIDWLALASCAEARLLIPMTVVRELDTHKRSNRQANVSDSNDELLRT